MDNTIKVSILVPIYNAGKYIERCLDSIFCQTYTAIEYVFVDNCSSDDSLNILERKIRQYEIQNSRIKLIIHDKNDGIAISRNDCIDNATGDYFLFVDSDDWIENDMVELMVTATKGGSIDIIGCDFIQEKSNGKKKYVFEPFADSCHENMIKAIDYEISSVLWKLLIKGSLFDKIRFTPYLDIVEDYIVTIKLYQYAESFMAVHKGLYHYMLNQESTSSKKMKSIYNHIRGVKMIEDYFKDEGLYNDVINHRLLLRKFNIKSNFLTKQLLDYKAYRNTFPESNRMWREMAYSHKEKLKFWLAEHNMFFILKILQE